MAHAVRHALLNAYACRTLIDACVQSDDGVPDSHLQAFAAYLRLGDKARYIGIGHGKNKRLPSCVDGKNVAIVDFSFDALTMAELEGRAKSFIVLDHHFSVFLT